MKNWIILAFLEGFFFLALELVGAQYLQVNFGSSYFMWIAVLSTVMLYSCGGYFLGSFLLRKDVKFRNWYVVISLVVILVWLTGQAKIHELLFVIFQGQSVFPALMLHTSLLTGLPVLLITSYSPLIISVAQNDYSEKGVASGKVFVFSTLGGIFSVYLLAFGMFPNIETTKVLYALFGVGFVVATFVIFKLGQTKLLIAVIPVLGIAFMQFKKFQQPVTMGNNTKVIHRENGIMGEVEIREEHGKYRYLNVNRMVQSGIRLESGTSALNYPYRIAAYTSSYPVGGKVLVAGLGGGVLVNQLLAFGFKVDVVDFDSRLLKVSKKYMSLDPTKFNFICDDIRHYLHTTSEKYDIIILDLSKGESIPTNVYTIEAFGEMGKHLKENGSIFLNYFSLGNGLGNDGLLATSHTLKSAGYFVAKIKKPNDDSNPEEIIVASKRPEILDLKKPLRISDNSMNTLGFVKQNYLSPIAEINQGMILKDNESKLELIQLEVVKDLREKSRNNEHLTFFSKK